MSPALCSAAYSGARWLAATTSPSDNSNDSGEGKKSGPLGLVIILVLCVACYFLFKSMSKHMKKVREQFPAELPVHGKPVRPPARSPAPPGPAGGDGADGPPPVDLSKPPD